jgi:hypothetical protein
MLFSPRPLRALIFSSVLNLFTNFTRATNEHFVAGCPILRSSEGWEVLWKLSASLFFHYRPRKRSPRRNLVWAFRPSSGHDFSRAQIPAPTSGFSR